jgi:NET1-associated nuclear protein 1 (U3 small nucleolar RNA-associated protein 17)
MISEQYGVSNLAFPPYGDDSNILYIAVGEGKRKVRFVTLNLEDNMISTLHKADIGKLLCFDVLSNGENSWLAFGQHDECSIYCPKTKEVFTLKKEPGEDFSAMCVHPLEFSVAIGTITGKILLWYCFDRSKTAETTSALHWHAHAVNSIAFASDSYMLSGGLEGVLVLWQLDTKHKDFLPRLGSDIKGISISPDKSLYALDFMDNTIRLLSAINLEIKQTIMGLKFGTLDHKAYPKNTGLVLEPSNECMVMNGVPGTMQFYNPRKGKHLLEVCLGPLNF